MNNPRVYLCAFVFLALTAKAQTPSKGTTLFPLPSGASAQGIVTGPDGALGFRENSGNQIGSITAAGAVTEFPLPAGITQPISITAGPGGALWFTTQAGAVGRMTTSGAVTTYQATYTSSPYL